MPAGLAHRHSISLGTELLGTGIGELAHPHQRAERAMRLDPVPRAEAHAVVDLGGALLVPFGCNPMELTDQDISNLVWLTGAAAVGMAIGINRELRGKPTAQPRSACAYAV